MILQVNLSDTINPPPHTHTFQMKIKTQVDRLMGASGNTPPVHTNHVSWKKVLHLWPWQIALSPLHPPSYKLSILVSLKKTNYNPTNLAVASLVTHCRMPRKKQNQNSSKTVTAEGICLNITRRTLGFLLQLTEARLSPEHQKTLETQVCEYTGSNRGSLLFLQTNQRIYLHSRNSLLLSNCRFFFNIYPQKSKIGVI